MPRKVNALPEGGGFITQPTQKSAIPFYKEIKSMGQNQGRLPDFIVIGATKTGTTSLDFYLSLHPEIHMARPKEPRFFIDEVEPKGRWQRGEKWYRSLFQTKKSICGEASPTYATWPQRQGVIERMSGLVPDAKIILVARDPLQRLRSSYLMALRYRGIESSFEAFLEKNDAIVSASMYGLQIQNTLRFYPIERIKVVQSLDLEARRHQTLEDIFRFLGADPSFRSMLFAHKRHVSSWHRYPNALGRKMLRSGIMRGIETRLPGAAFYHFRNCLNAVFAGGKPSTALPSELEIRLKAKFREDLELLERLTGEFFPLLSCNNANEPATHTVP